MVMFCLTAEQKKKAKPKKQRRRQRSVDEEEECINWLLNDERMGSTGRTKKTRTLSRIRELQRKHPHT